ncbi:MAG TPA: fructosamine kinase family protein [Usitatibacter sp.]|nr:fructosamine kinase family protein [Usitatibacter sp.]
MKARSLLERIAKSISTATGNPFTASSSAPVTGGCIHEAWKVEGKTRDAAQAYFAKVGDVGNLPMFVAESEGLEAIDAAAAVRTPAVVVHGDDGERAWLVLEWLELHPLDGPAAARLGASLAAQHRVAQARFGWANDNFIGASPQSNGWSDDWLAFWRERRLMAQLRMAARKRLPSKMIDRGERLAADCGEFFRGYQPARSLLHGDLWAGNAASLEDGSALVFDPAVYVGDREADIAMTELFGGFPPDFLAAYRAAWAPHDDYRVRRDLYNLYHVLNHSNLFAGTYVRQAEVAIERLLSEVG